MSSAIAQKLGNILDEITAARTRLIGTLKVTWWIKPGFLTHLIGPLIAFIVIVATFQRTRQLTFFSLHPICMSLAFIVLIPEGVVAYRNQFILDSLAPIMQYGTKRKNRMIHMILQVLATIFAALGLVFILGNKAVARKSFFPRSLHGILGIIVLVAIAMQVAIGRLKHVRMAVRASNARSRGKRYRWHGKMGLLVYDMGIVTFLLGVVTFFGWSITIAVVPILVGLAWLNVHLQMHESRNISAQPHTEAGDTESGDSQGVEVQKLMDDQGATESKGDRDYPL